MDGHRSIPLWRAADHRSRGPDVLKGHTKMVVGLAACKNLVCKLMLIFLKKIKEKINIAFSPYRKNYPLTL